MNNLWPSSFDEHEFALPKEILEQQGNYLSKLTGEMVFGEVDKMDKDTVFELSYDGFEEEFNYDFLLRSNLLLDYNFRVLSFSHDITIYPIIVRVEEGVVKELGISSPTRIKTEEDFVDLIARVFNSKRMKRVVGAMIKLAKS